MTWSMRSRGIDRDWDSIRKREKAEQPSGWEDLGLFPLHVRDFVSNVQGSEEVTENVVEFCCRPELWNWRRPMCGRRVAMSRYSVWKEKRGRGQ